MADNPKKQDLDYLETADVGRVHMAAVEREKTNLATRYEPMSITALLLCFVGFLIGGAFLNKYGGPVAYQPPLGAIDVASIQDTRPFDPNAAAAAMSPFDKAMKAGAQVYNACAACHQADGKGQPGVFPPLAESEYVIHGTERFGMAVLNGVQGPITAAGQHVNSIMPPQGAMSDEDIAAVMTYVRNSFGNKASMVYPEGVKGLREKIKSRPPGAVTEAELKAIPEDAMLAVPEGSDKPVEGAAPAADAPKQP